VIGLDLRDPYYSSVGSTASEPYTIKWCDIGRAVEHCSQALEYRGDLDDPLTGSGLEPSEDILDLLGEDAGLEAL
jgi:hypothetical protein